MVSSRLHNIDVLLDAYTPVDLSVQTSISSSTLDEHRRELRKRFSIAAESIRPGAGAAALRHVIDEWDSPADLVQATDGVLEFGLLPHELNQHQQERTERAEIRQEVHRFDRIMDLSALEGGRCVVKQRRDLAHNGTLGAVERILVLLQERQMIRGDRRLQWHDIASVEQRLVKTVGSGHSLERTVQPHVIAVVDEVGGPEALETLESYCLLHPLPVALGMSDYSRFISSAPPSHMGLIGISPLANGRHEIETWAATTCSLVLYHKDGCLHRVTSTHVLDGTPLGSADTRYGHVILTIGDDDRVLLSMDGGLLADHADLESVLNTPGRKGIVDLHANVVALVGGCPYITSRPAHTRPMAAPDMAAEETVAANSIVNHAGDAGRLLVAVECGHIHADRDMGPAQLRGLELGATMMRECSRLLGDRLVVDVTPMVDDDHVLNRFSFSKYRSLFSRHGMKVDDLVLESSPLPRAICHDVLRRALTQKNGCLLDP